VPKVAAEPAERRANSTSHIDRARSDGFRFESPLHNAKREADFDTVPGDSDVIHDRNVLGLLLIIEDQTFDPLFDGFGLDSRDWLRTRTPKPAWQRRLHARQGH
jgi:hypothetical protein